MRWGEEGCGCTSERGACGRRRETVSVPLPCAELGVADNSPGPVGRREQSISWRASFLDSASQTYLMAVLFCVHGKVLPSGLSACPPLPHANILNTIHKNTQKASLPVIAISKEPENLPGRRILLVSAAIPGMPVTRHASNRHKTPTDLRGALLSGTLEGAQCPGPEGRHASWIP
jgi:hypothetical protein